jgi:hypothetical protein
LAASLGLTANEHTSVRGESPLLLAVASLQTAGVLARAPHFDLTAPETVIDPDESELDDPPSFRADAKHLETPDVSEPLEREQVVAPSRPVGPARKALTPARVPLPPKSGPRPAAMKPGQPMAPAQPATKRKTPPPATKPAPTAAPTRGFAPQAAPLWVGLAVVLGVGLRFIDLPRVVLPIGVGLAVGAAMILLLRVILVVKEDPVKKATRTTAKIPVSGTKKPSSGSGAKAKDPSARLTAIAKRLPAGSPDGRSE